MKKLFQLVYLFFKKLLGKSLKSTPSSFSTTLNSHTVSYCTHLIPSLKDSHQKLIKVYKQIEKSLKLKQYEEIKSLINTLNTDLQHHITQEDMSFYSYLEQQFSNQPDYLDFVKMYKEDMHHISQQLMTFIKKWQNETVSDTNVALFQKEYLVIGQVLTQRISGKEDQLYPLYQPSF